MGIIARQSFKASIANYIGALLGFLNLFILFPKFFNPEELGAVRLIIELSMVLSAFALLGTNYSINRFFPFFKTEDQKHHGFFFWVVIIPGIGFLLLLLILSIVGDSFFVFINKNALDYKALFPALLLLILANIYLIVSETTSANHGRTAIPNFSREVIMRIMILLSGSLFYFNIVTFETCIYLVALSYYVPLVLNVLFLRSLTKINLKPDLSFLKNNPKLIKEITAFTGVLLFSALASIVIPRIDFFMVSKIQNNLAELAVYSIGFYLATFIDIPKRTVLQISLPIIATHLKSNEIKKVDQLHKKNATVQLIISTLLFFLIWVNIDNLYQIMPRGEFYSKGKWVVFIIGLAKIVESLNSMYSSILANSKLYKSIPVLIALNGFLVIGLSYYFVLRFGLVGGAMGTCSSIIFLNLVCGLYIYRKLKIHPLHKSQFMQLLIFLVFMTTTLAGNWFANPYIDGIVRTALLGGLFIFASFKLKISEDFNNLIKQWMPKWMNIN